MHYLEYEEIKEDCRKKNVSPEGLLEEKVKPLEKILSKSHGELVSAITRDYESSYGMNLLQYSLRENLYAGITMKINLKEFFSKRKEMFGL